MPGYLKYMNRLGSLLDRMQEKNTPETKLSELGREVKRLMMNGASAERACIEVAKKHGLSLKDLELLHLAAKPKG